ncbi:Cholinesterase 4 [Colletotrichum truncatum]|uniref:Cholinesterase 4 n=1 Tax=Colletotrichum truncatum TaxID=5467 RepID=A0ACC3YW29_COLTU|nr:Cholinesterase 4 [Colletotrichum truncatum]KAF6791124.1 Cholinesterase 4 [Colletotrichum truncatum]
MDAVGKRILDTTNCINAANTTLQLQCLQEVPAATLSVLGDPARYLVVDRIYLVSDGLEVWAQGMLGSNGINLRVHLMMAITAQDSTCMHIYPRNDTGVNGYIGSTIFKVSLDQGFSVRKIVRSASKNQLMT